MRLEREKVIQVALALLDEVGLDGLTVRRLAERLGVQNPALYWHFKNKQELLNRMAEVMLAEAFTGLDQSLPPEAWAAWLADVARRLRHALLSYRDGARLMAAADLSSSERTRSTAPSAEQSCSVVRSAIGPWPRNIAKSSVPRC